MSSDIIEYTVKDLCELIKIAIDTRQLDKAQNLLDKLKLISSSTN